MQQGTDRPGDRPALDEQMVEAMRRQREHVAASHAVDRRGWTREQWVADARRLLDDVDGSVMDLVNGHILAMLARIAELEADADPCADIPDAPVPEPYQPPQGTYARLGRKKPKNLYLVTPDCPEGMDIGRLDTPELAALVRDAVNDYLIAVDRRREREEAADDG